MKQIHYRIFRGEDSRVFKITITESVFKILVFYFPQLYSNDTVNLLSKDITKKMDGIEDKMVEIQYDMIYDIMENTLGIKSREVVDLTIEDYQDDKIIVHVYLEID
jgi:hypothetical protein